MSSARRRMLFWTLPIALTLLSGLLFAGLVFANQTLNGFGIDSNDTLAQSALYSGLSNGAPSNDWAAGPDGGSGVFRLSTDSLSTDCYGSNVEFDAINGVAAFICDGHADTAFSGGDPDDLADEEELNIVSSGKQTDNVWVIKNPSGTSGLGTGKSDITHAYAYLSFGDSCFDPDGVANNLFLYMAGHRADNEGDAFWGFEFNQNAPANFSTLLYPTEDSTQNLVFDRQTDDLLVSGEVVKTAGEHEVNLQLLRWDGTTYVPASSKCATDADAHVLTSNVNHDIEAPPWNIPLCDGTILDPNMKHCRLSSGGGDVLEAANLLAPRDFMEVGIDLEAYGISQTCFANSFIFTSRSSSSVNSALKDVGGADFHACDANISINPVSAINEVNHPHEFTVTVNKVVIGESSPAAVAPVTISVSPEPNMPLGGSCITDGVTGPEGTCTVIIDSSLAGPFEIYTFASVEVVDGEGFIVVTTDGNVPNSGPATKTFVDAGIGLSPNASNKAGDDHIFVVTVMEDDGSGMQLASGEQVEVSYTDSFGAQTQLPDSCTTRDGLGFLSDGTSDLGKCEVSISSGAAGQILATATSHVQVGGLSLTRTTSSTKTYVDAKISIDPLQAYNRVGDPHTFTVTVEADNGSRTFMPAPGEKVTPTLTGVGNITDGTCQSGTTNDLGKCTIIVSSVSTGVGTVGATVTINVGGVNVTRSLGDGFSGDSPKAKKTWVDARISIDPSAATNEVGEPHPYTVTLEIDDGSGAGFVAAPVDNVVGNVTIGLFPTTTLSSNTCASYTLAGPCNLSIVSNSTDIFTITASAVVSVLGEEIRVSTDAQDRNSGPATKTYVDARITIDADSTNKVGSNHTFTVTVEKDDSSRIFMPAPGETVIPSITGTGSIPADPNGGTCQSGTTDDLGKCTIIVSSASTGIGTIGATVTVNIGGVNVTRSLGDGQSGDSPKATKTWVDAQITIDADSTNEVGSDHTFTVTVKKHTGTGSFVGAAGEPVAPSITGTGSIPANPNGGTCQSGTTNDLGKCTIIVSSASTGIGTVGATVTVNVGGVNVTRSLGDSLSGDSPEATKTWVDAQITIDSNSANEVGFDHIFTVTVKKDTGTGSFVGAAGETVAPSITGTGSIPANLDGGTCQSGTTDSSGKCTIVVSSASTDVGTVGATVSVNAGGVNVTRSLGDGLSGDSPKATKTWVDAYISLEYTETILEVEQGLTFTVIVKADDGSGGLTPTNVESVTIIVPDGVTIVENTNTCTTGTVNGTCTVTVTSTYPDTYTITATADVVVLGQVITVSTEGTATFVDARIELSPDAANVVGDPHIFVVTVMEDDGSGSGMLLASGEFASVTFQDPFGAQAHAPASCTTGDGVGFLTDGTSNQGKCEVTLNSETAGQILATATSDVQVGGLSLTRSANSTKTYVDASIGLSPNATNKVDDEHIFVVTVMEDDGSGSGMQLASGEFASVTFQDPFGAEAQASASCTTGDGVGFLTDETSNQGKCEVTLNSVTAGQFLATATSHVQVGGLSLTRSASSTKTFVDARISVTPDGANPIDAPYTFTILVEQNDGSGWSPVTGALHPTHILNQSQGGNYILQRWQR